MNTPRLRSGGDSFFIKFSFTCVGTPIPGIVVIARWMKYTLRPNLMRDRKRKMPDRKSAVFDRAKSFSFRKKKLSLCEI